MPFPGDTKSNPSLLPQGPPQPLYADVEGHPQALIVPARERKSLGRRILRGFLFIFVTLWIIHAVHRVFLGRSWFHKHGQHKEFDMADPDYYYDIPSDLVLEDCVQGAGWSEGEADGPYSTAITTFEVPLSADSVYILSRGRFSSGVVNVVSSPDQAKDSVSVEVTAKYRRDYILEVAKACLTSRPGNQKGVGIFTPIWRHTPHRHDVNLLHFETVVTLPEDIDPITGFETDVPNTLQTIGYLENKVNFESLLLRGSNMPIFVEAISAINGSVHTTNAGIRGSFNTTSSLILETTNAPIDVTVGLDDVGEQPTFVAHTTNGHIDARVGLHTESGKGGNFTVDTTTTNSPLFTYFIDAPLNSTLNFHARSTNGRVEATLHPTYEGDFDASTSRFFKADLKFLPAPDPSGLGRKRATLVQSLRNRVFGNSIWLDHKNPVYGRNLSSSVVLTTSNSPVILTLIGN